MITKKNKRRFLFTMTLLVSCPVLQTTQAISALTPDDGSLAAPETIPNLRIPHLHTPATTKSTGASGIAAWYQQRTHTINQAATNIQALTRQAEAGDNNAQYQLGLIYQGGRGVQQDAGRAQQLFTQAAKAGNAYAQYALALLYRGQGDQRSIQQSIKLQQQAAQQGHPEAQYGLGLLYANGQYVGRDTYKAKHWYQQATNRGHVTAKLALNDLARQAQARPQPKPKPVRRPVTSAVRQPLPAASAASVAPFKPVNRRPTVAQVRPAPVYRPPKPVQPVQQRPVQPQTPQKIAVKHHESQVDLAGMGTHEIRRSAEKGDMYSQLMLGALYEDGGEGIAKDPQQAFQWYAKAARQGYPKAQHNLALLYEDGRGTQQNYAQAAAWYQRAAQSGFSEAQNNLAVLYILGNGVKQDRNHAEQLLRQAVAQGNVNAKRNLNMLMKMAESGA